MSTLPNIDIQPPRDEDRRALALWLEEWETHQALQLSGEEPGTAGTPADYPGVDSLGESVSLEEGQVLLLQPRQAPEADRPVYIALLEGNGEEWIAIPFGRFRHPAFPGEIASGRDDLYLRVICLWNAARVPGRTLQLTWFAGELSATEINDLREAWQSWQARSGMPRRLAHRAGPPIVHPLDPRYDYIDEESSVMSGIAGSHLIQEPGALYDFPGAPASSPRDLPLAAEPREKYGSGKKAKKPRKDG